MSPKRKPPATAPEGTPSRATLVKRTHQTTEGVYTDLGPDYGSVYLSHEDFRRFRKDYSKGWGGKALNQDEIATQWGFPDTHAVAEFVRIHGLRHTSIPFTDAELAEKGVSAAVDEATLELRQGYRIKARNAERGLIERDAMKWHSLEDSIRAVIGELLRAPKAGKVKPLVLSTPERPFFALIGSTDIHFGKIAHDHLGSVIYDPAITARQVAEAVNELLRKITRLGRPERVYLMVGSDNLHVDTPSRQTTRGTPLAVSTSSALTHPALVSGYVQMTLDLVDRVRQLGCEVVLVLVPGNHDQATSLLVFELLKRVYASTPGVRFLARPDEPIFFENCGNVTLGFNHGEEVKKKNIHREFLIEAPRQGVEVQRTLVMATGHLHHLADIDCEGVDWIQFPSPGPADDYHKKGRWAHARACMAAAVYTLDGDKDATLFGRARAS